MSKTIRVLHVFGGLNRGGAETMVMNLYRKIDIEKVQFDFIIHDMDKLDYCEEIKKMGGNIYNMPKFKGVNFYEYIRCWNSFFKEHPEYRIVHSHVRSTAAIFLFIAKKYNCYTIAHSHNTSSGVGIKACVKNVFQYPIRFIADSYFACSINAGEWLFGKKKCKTNRFHILNNAIDSEKFIYNEEKRNIIRREMGLEGRCVIGHIGRFHPQKNHIKILEIFKHFHNDNNNSILVLIGDGDLRDKIKNRVEELEITNYVKFIKVCDNVEDIMQAMDIFIFPSLFEGLGIVAIEAQAAGLKCLVSNTLPKEAFISDLIEEFSLKKSSSDWAEKLNSIYIQKYTRKDTSKIIKQHGYDINKTVSELTEYYLSI